MIFSGLDDKVRSLLRYQLYIDFLFMAAVYPGIASLCMIGYHKNKRWGLKKLLLVFAALQGLAWLCDIFENRYLLKWISDPGAIGELGFYHALVWTKWLVALSGLTAALLSLFRRTNSPNPAKS
jgi:hypothetical protein